MEDHGFIVNAGSIWVMASWEGVTGNERARVLSDSSMALRMETNHGPGVPLFTDTEAAEDFIAGSELDGWEPARFESVLSFCHFLIDMGNDNVVCFPIGPVAGKQHARITSLEDLARSVQTTLDGLKDRDSR